MRIFLLEHELSQFTEPKLDKHGNKKWSIQEHDLRDKFSKVVKRHGVCIGSSHSLTAAAEEESLGGEGDDDRARKKFQQDLGAAGGIYLISYKN